MEPNLTKKSLFKGIIKNQLVVTVVTGIFLLTMIIGSSYAVFNQKIFNTENDVVVQSGNLEVVISNQSDMIEMNYTTLGVSDEVGLTYDPYSFTVENTGKADIAYYEIRIVDKEYEISTLPHKSLNFAIAVNNSNYQAPQNLGDNDSYIYVGSDLNVGETDSFNLKLWVNEEWGKYANNKTLKASIEVTLYSEDPTRNYIVYDTQGGNFVTKTSVFSKRVTQKVPSKLGYEFIGWSTSSNGEIEYESNAIYQNDIGIVLYAIYEEETITYDLNGGTGSIASNKISQGITTTVPTREGYNFIGWSTNPNATEAEYQSGDSYLGKSITLYAMWEELPNLYDKIETTLASYLLADDGDARIISGSKTQLSNNYVWYSGKLWRIVALNNDRSIKLITNENITTINWYESGEEDWMYQWLNEDFLDTLYNYNDLLVKNYKWNATQTTSTTKPENTTLVEMVVGLLNYYEYIQSYSKANSSTGYLNNGYRWWLLTPHTKTWNFKPWGASENGSAISVQGISNFLGVRPSINLKSNIKIGCTVCDGSKTNPYTIAGDISAPIVDEFLNNRVSGEYVTFDNELYRIVSIENEVTKITKVDYIKDNSGTVITKYLTSGGKYGASDNIQGIEYWDYYLNNTWYNNISLNYKNMIQTGTWYVGAYKYCYKDTICATSNTTATTKNCVRTSEVYNGNVGLGRPSEMFTSQLGEGQTTSYDIWTITPSGSTINSILAARQVYTSGSGTEQSVSNLYAARPSVNLKSTIKITGGLGTKESPFTISE